ncbi:MAG: hypothetical protein WC205_01580 [Opitutaceae bacterium]|jgi:hypothetical protein
MLKFQHNAHMAEEALKIITPLTAKRIGVYPQTIDHSRDLRRQFRLLGTKTPSPRAYRQR